MTVKIDQRKMQWGHTLIILCCSYIYYPQYSPSYRICGTSYFYEECPCQQGAFSSTNYSRLFGNRFSFHHYFSIRPYKYALYTLPRQLIRFSPKSHDTTHATPAHLHKAFIIIIESWILALSILAFIWFTFNIFEPNCSKILRLS